MKTDIEKRAIMLGEYIIKHSSTVRGAAKYFSVSKSTVHKDVALRLKEIDPALFKAVRAVLILNKEERHIRGGIVTREKYRKLKENS
ncbi:MAG: sporulation transcriptional regulator SpoIIID [Clostridia bacterium]|nr:sporulation transcriptional regulator SpoIIID [Clostridia bacterium]